MIRFTLMQSRAFMLVGAIGLGVVAIVLAITGPHLAHVYDAFESSCKTARDCDTVPNPVLNLDRPLQSALPFIVAIAPALIGLFFGAPLIARELETGTFRLAWTQSVTRKRWLAAKLGVVGVVAMAIGGLLTWMARLVGESARRGESGSLRRRQFQRPRHCADRVCGVRLRARSDGRCGAAKNGGGDGRHGRRVRGGACRGSRTGFARTSSRPCASRSLS